MARGMSCGWVQVFQKNIVRLTDTLELCRGVRVVRVLIWVGPEGNLGRKKNEDMS